MLQSPEPLRLFLDRLTSRSVLTGAEQQAILALPAQACQVPSNKDFVRLGERVDYCCLIVDGLVGRFDQNAQGGRQITALHIPGDIPDLLSVVQPTATSALHALTTTTLLRVPHAALRAAASAHPAIAEAFWRDTMVDAMILAQWVVNVGRRDARTRVAHLLCEMAYRYRVDLDAPEVVFELQMTQEQLADATGLTSVHVNRTLMLLREQGVTVSRPRVTIANWKALVKLADFDPSYLQADIKPTERMRIIRPAA